MNLITDKNVIPGNNKGKAVDLALTIEAPNPDEAARQFEDARQRLLQPSLWQKLAGTGTASFVIVGGQDEETNRTVRSGDYLRIDIPGPGSAAGRGYDWVQVEFLDEDVINEADKSVVLRLRASAHPEHPDDGIAHFFTGDATSSFVLQRKGHGVTLSYHGRNEEPNTHETGSVDTVRNGLVAAGARAGLSEQQWKALLQGILPAGGKA